MGTTGLTRTSQRTKKRTTHPRKSKSKNKRMRSPFLVGGSGAVLCCLLVLDQGRQPSSAAAPSAAASCPGQGAVSFALSKKTELRLCHILLRASAPPTFSF